MRVVVTGGAGYIGSMLVPRLLEMGWDVHVLDNLMFGGQALLPHFMNPRFSFAEVDITRRDELAPQLKGADAVIHLVCENCGATRHHDAALVEDLRDQISATADFAPSVIDVRVLGTCAACPAQSTTE